jgi:homoserine kinase
VQDRVHQERRFAAAPQSKDAYQAALDAGAWCAWLSGSGPTVAALCAPEAADELAATMVAALGDVGHAKVLRIDDVGATLTV